ncbi:hypothetical protein KFU94_34455 [Chloroflexi bacterium TSY]|nr:hypothetical protein [Chloroflexi bacterium TSY]
MVRPLSRSQHTAPSFQPAVLATESSLELDEKKRERVVWRTDGGAGSEENIRWLLNRNYQFMMKGNSNRRAHLWAQQVTRWDPCGDVFLAEIPSPIKFNRPVRIFLKKKSEKRANLGVVHFSWIDRFTLLETERTFIFSDFAGSQRENGLI